MKEKWTDSNIGTVRRAGAGLDETSAIHDMNSFTYEQLGKSSVFVQRERGYAVKT